MPARNAEALPRLLARLRHVAPLSRASLPVPSLEPSSITTTSSTCGIAPPPTLAICEASLKAGTIAQILMVRPPVPEHPGQRQPEQIRTHGSSVHRSLPEAHST